ncbi:hypothetical protein [Arundinibacter roseus]|uniref:HIRAN domain-containing protein n=1 Tax=Arundinibacter roseus TaxID=2070510 RepID=A0A4R4KKF6_9BACT|nr:hypothetical protein [Arundinibacter roseus]TDB67091.1 hypothetical protein EZE20_08230 [Arundinibacter roseus]
MITIENQCTVRVDGRLVGYIPTSKWNDALLALGATGGFRKEAKVYTATPMLRYKPRLVKTLKQLMQCI